MSAGNWLAIYIGIGWVIRLLMVPVILRRQFAPGAAVAWLGVIFLHPIIGLTLYLTLGETRLGPHRVERHRALVNRYRTAMREATGSELDRCSLSLPPAYEPLVVQAEKISGLPVLGGNGVEFLTECTPMIDRLVADIDAATSHVHLLYYMFVPDATGNRVADALVRAEGRGVKCRVLADAVASRRFFHHDCGLAPRLRAAGIEVTAALPVAVIKRRLPRMDLRNHRKLAVIDGRIGYCGSHNLVNPDYGGRRGGPWVDVTGRFTGPIVSELAVVFAEDWGFETNQMLEVCTKGIAAPLNQGTPMQVVPTGPTSVGESFRRVFLAAIQSAQSRVMMTTPYFVPDEPTLVALSLAADRGADVSLLLPKVPDHLFTAAAGRAHFARLMDSGVKIYLYRKGLLHTKSTTVDDTFAVFGSANLDVRSFNLNFELTTLLYGEEVTSRLRGVQESYLADSEPLDAARWAQRSTVKRYTDSAISLLSPLL
ncbi:MAG TPA: cardiolipin synthase [Tepidisphaeraceae bacterium]|jgi:cardiolipin synthase